MHRPLDLTPKRALCAALGAAFIVGLLAAPAQAATTSLSMTVDPAAPSSQASISLQSSVTGTPQPALQALTIAMPKGFSYRGPQVATVCRAADLEGFEPRCPESSLVGTGKAIVEFRNGNVTGTAQVDPVRMYHAGPDDVLLHMKALAPISRGVVIPSTVLFTDPDFGPVFRIGPAVGAGVGTLALTSFSFTSKPGVFGTASCETGAWLAAGRYLFLGGATQEINPRIACNAPGGPPAPATGTASAPTPGAALTVAGIPVSQSPLRRALGNASIRVTSTSLRARNGRVAVRLQCRSQRRCMGTLRLQHRRPAGGVARYGATRFSINGRSSRTISVRLRARGNREVRRGRVVTWARAHIDGAARQRDSVRKLTMRR